MADRLVVERDGAVMRVWFDRPEKLNALDTAVLEEITALFEGLGSDFSVRVVVLGGRGTSFCAGADRTDPPGMARMSFESGAGDRERRWWSHLGTRAVAAVANCDVVTVARLHGHVVGGGAALALACDFRVAAEDTVFHVPEVDLGIPLSWGAVPLLIREVGAARAREIVLLAERFDTSAAVSWGLVHRSVPSEDLDAAVAGLAERLAAIPEAAVHMTKTQFRAYSHRLVEGDVTETDGDLLLEASRSAIARAAFGRDG